MFKSREREPSEENWRRETVQDFLGEFRKFCESKIGENAEYWDRDGSLPRSIFRDLASIGYFGLVAPEKYGGSELGISAGIQAMAILSEYCGSTFFSAGASFGLFGEPLRIFGTDEQKERFYKPVLSGDKIGCLGITEPHSGSDVGSVQTVANQSANGEIFLSGQKTYITNASIADYAIILARFHDSQGKDWGLTHFLVDLDNPGISRGKPMKKLGLRASVTGELFFDQAKIGGMETILGGKGKGFRQTMMTFNEERLSIAAYCLGVVNSALKESIRFAKTRRSFGKPIHEHQSVSNLIAEIYTKKQAIQSFLDSVTEEMQAKEESGLESKPGLDPGLGAKCAALKYFASESAREAVHLAVQIHGGAGFMEEYKVSRLYRDIRLAEIGGGTSEIQKTIIASFALKEFK
jgi:alkylation response protein AidB-like acyl-CoA dehydrogenase